MSDKVTVNLNHHGGSIVVGEHDISGDVRSVTVHGRAGAIPTVELDLVTAEVTAEAGPVVVHMSSATRNALVNMGWTPPDFDALLGTGEVSP